MDEVGADEVVVMIVCEKEVKVVDCCVIVEIGKEDVIVVALASFELLLFVVLVVEGAEELGVPEGINVLPPLVVNQSSCVVGSRGNISVK